MRSQSLLRLILMTLLLLAIAVAATLLLSTEKGQEILHNPHRYQQNVRNWTQAHRIIGPLAFTVVFVIFGVLAMPLWWLCILAGAAFGLVGGVLMSQIAAALAAVAAASVSRFLMADWFHHRVESHVAKLKSLNEKLGRNGFLVVCVVRLSHFFPAGISNYAFGLTNMSLRDIALGTLIGGLPTAAFYAAVGTAMHPLSDWRYLAALAALNLLVVAIILVRYLRPRRGMD
jgi:uncharacterized membrane protein YdjX (TVP38/TMEM64 family)